MSASGRTVVDCILLAADDLSREMSTFSAEDLVVKAWRLYPDRFGLQGYASMYPDSNRVLTKIMGASGRLRKDGLIERTGEKRYRLTEAGRREAARLSALHPNAGAAEHLESAAPKRLAGIDRSLLVVLHRLRNSKAFRKFQRVEPLSFSDVAAFLNISARSTANQLNVRIAEARAALDAARNAMRAKSATLPGKNEVFVSEDIEQLDDLMRTILTKFAADLAIIRSRSDERYL
jgi:hypothetical protein